MDFANVLIELKHQIGLETDYTQTLFGMALLLSRVLPVVLLTPFIGGEAVPQEIKLGLSLIIALMLFPAVTPQLLNIPLTALVFIALMLKEIFIGLSFAFVVNIVFDAANVAGNLIDTMSGTNQAQVMVPQTAQQVSLFSNLKLQLTVVTFLTLDGHHIIIQAMGDSIGMIPLDQFPRFSHGFWPFFDLIIRVAGDMLRISLALASPVLLATFLTDLALGMINRVAPQVQVFFVAMQLKPAVTTLVMFATIHLILGRLTTEFGVMFVWLRRCMELLT